jgi:hypothetical protein
MSLVLQGVSLTGPGPGLVVAGGEVTLGGLDIRDTGAEGIRIDEGRVSIRGSVIAGATGVGLRSRARRLDLHESVIRDTRPLPDGADGRGLVVEGDGVDVRATVGSSVLLRHARAAIDVVGGLLDVSSSLVADTGRDASTLEGGHGIAVTSEGSVASGLTVEGVMIVGNAGAGIRLVGGWATLVDALIRGPAGTPGWGLVTEVLDDLTANVNLTRCTIEGAGIAGLDLASGEVRADGILVLDTGAAPLAPGADPASRAGLVARTAPGEVRLVDSVIARTRGAGLAATGRSVSITTSVVQGAAPAPDGTGGAGVTARCVEGTGICATVSIARSLVEDSAGSGLAVSGGRLVVSGIVVRRSGGDAVTATCAETPADCGDLRVTDAVLTDAPGAGIRLAGPGAQVEGGTILETGTAVEATCDATADRCGQVRLAHLHARGYRDAGLRLLGVDARVETALLLGDREDGDSRALHGLLAGCSAAGCGRLDVHLSRLSGHAGTGLLAEGQPVRLVGVMVDDVDAGGTPDADPDHGEGIVIACDPGSGACGVASLSGVLVTDVAGVGILLAGTSADVTSTRVLGVKPRASDGDLGYGVQAGGSEGEPGVRVDLRYCHVSGAAAVGVVYAGATGDLLASLVDGTVLPVAWTDPDAAPAVDAHCTLEGSGPATTAHEPGLEVAAPP